jgi:hypothetical protein
MGRRLCASAPQVESAGACPWIVTMHTDITDCLWKRRGVSHCARKPARKRERRPLGFLGPGAARLRRFMKRSCHRHARRTVRAGLRASTAAPLDH